VEFSIRLYEPDDAAALAEVMWSSVRTAALADYSPEQTNAWLPEAPLAEAMHRWASDGRCVLVAANVDGRVVGYIDLASDGHIDHLYCSPEAVGQGVASALYDTLERTASSQGLSRLDVEASEAARRLFEKKGFTVEGRRDWELRGVSIHNYKMSKGLRPDPRVQ
jgi:putative acetyltransferase